MEQPENFDEKQKPTVAVTLFRWFVTNTILPLLPLFFVWFALRLSNQSVDWTKSTDLLFFTVMLTLSALVDISSTIKTLQTDLVWNVMYYGMVIGLVLSTGFYGLLLYNVNGPSADEPTSLMFRQNLHPWVIAMALFFVVASTFCRYLVAKVECKA